MGPNGAGKTTLIKTLIGREKADAGEVEARPQGPGRLPRPGARSRSPPETTVVRAVWPEDDPDWVEGDVRDLLARFGLSRRDRLPDRRPALRRREGQGRAGPALRPPAANLLVMDEPTNHLDIWSCEALERSIKRVRGDGPGRQPRPLLPQPGRRPPDRRRRRPGPGHRGGLRDLPAPRPAGEAERRRQGRRQAGHGPRGRRRRPPIGKAEKRKRKFPYRKAADLEREIAEVEAEVAELEDLLGQPATWRDPVKAVGTQDRHDELKAKLETLYEHWEEAVEFELRERSARCRGRRMRPVDVDMIAAV